MTTQAAVDWQQALDVYLAATREQEALTAAAAKAGLRRAQALAAMRAAGVGVPTIAYVVDLGGPDPSDDRLAQSALADRASSVTIDAPHPVEETL